LKTATAYMLDGSADPITWVYQQMVAALVALTQEVDHIFPIFIAFKTTN